MIAFAHTTPRRVLVAPNNTIKRSQTHTYNIRESCWLLACTVWRRLVEPPRSTHTHTIHCTHTHTHSTEQWEYIYVVCLTVVWLFPLLLLLSAMPQVYNNNSSSENACMRGGNGATIIVE